MEKGSKEADKKHDFGHDEQDNPVPVPLLDLQGVMALEGGFCYYVRKPAVHRVQQAGQPQGHNEQAWRVTPAGLRLMVIDMQQEDHPHC